MVLAASERMQKRLLLVEDGECASRPLQRFFESRGFRVDCARELEEAEALLANYSYEVVISGVRLTLAHGSEGLQILSFIHQHCPSTRTVMLAARANAEIEAEAVDRGVDLLEREAPSLGVLTRNISRLLETRIVRGSLIDSVLRTGAITIVFQPAFEMDDSADQSPSVHFLECLSRGPKGTNMESAGVLFEYARRKGREMALDLVCIDAAFRAVSESGHAAGDFGQRSCLDPRARARFPGVSRGPGRRPRHPSLRCDSRNRRARARLVRPDADACSSEAPRSRRAHRSG